MTAFDDLELLRAFACIVESGTISAAARVLRLPQPTLSRHLRTLEDRAGTTLLLRDTHRMRLTEAGHRFLEDARGMLALAEEATDRLRADRTVLHGHLRLFATVDLGQSHLTRLVARFLLAHPGLRAELGYSNRPVQMIENGYDAGVVAGEIADERLVARRIGTIHRCLVASPDYLRRAAKPKQPSDLKSHRWLALSQPQFGGAPESTTFLGPRKATETLPIAPVLVSEGVTSLRQALLEGLGVSVMPLWLIHDDLASGRLVRILPEWTAPSIPLSVIHLAQRALPARIRAFLDFVAIHMTAELEGLPPPAREKALGRKSTVT
ncbi:Transcriptional regulator, LysR family [Labilithrix luteola]|uniref:Transcriptional regulator, LysR family n=1 Tax=Labilithrix luteola TaxID=1391654 RepID=A0A0K1PQ88_9BACT|nr:LysR family transcriptional regulator [Labilithrix luteola]AKU95269.1 Transcriptional regulator, LysR family [Labilithrix luteola]